MIALTHLVFGLAVTRLMALPVVWGMIGAVFPDVDLLLNFAFPFTHRGILHTPLAAGFATVLLLSATRRNGPGAALGLGYLSHLFRSPTAGSCGSTPPRHRTASASSGTTASRSTWERSCWRPAQPPDGPPGRR
ncbi:MAG: metal-dependent hydrolase [Candidatus Nanohaloarchaea archaeon]